jgi:hypothetical protein
MSLRNGDSLKIDLPGYPGVRIVTAKYAAGDGLAVRVHLEDGEPLLTVSVNDPSQRLETNEIIAKVWSENAPFVAPLLATGLFEPTGRSVAVGFCEAPVWRVLFLPKAPSDPTPEADNSDLLSCSNCSFETSSSADLAPIWRYWIDRCLGRTTGAPHGRTGITPTVSTTRR